HDRRHRLRVERALHDRGERFRHRRRRDPAHGTREAVARAGARAEEQAAVHPSGRVRRRQPATLPRRGLHPRRRDLPQSGEAFRHRRAGDHRGARLVHRRRGLHAGPPLLKAATGEIATDEELGGAVMHTHVSGLGEYLAEDDADGVRFAREVIARLSWGATPAPSGKPPRYSADELLGIMPPEHRTPVDMREVIARFADDSDFLDFKPDYGPATVCGHAAVQGFAVGIVTNNGPLDPDGATKATHFIQACCQAGLPILYLQNTTGYIVGKASEEAGMIKHGSKMIQAVANANVPQITVMCGASFGAGNYGMCGRAYDPRFLFSWPNATTAVMGAEQAALTMAIVMEGGAKRKGIPVDFSEINSVKEKIIQNFEKQQSAFVTSALLLDDGIIDPRDTRNVLGFCLSLVSDRRELKPIQFGVARP